MQLVSSTDTACFSALKVACARWRLALEGRDHVMYGQGALQARRQALPAHRGVNGVESVNRQFPLCCRHFANRHFPLCCRPQLRG